MLHCNQIQRTYICYRRSFISGSETLKRQQWFGSSASKSILHICPDWQELTQQLKYKSTRHKHSARPQRKQEESPAFSLHKNITGIWGWGWGAGVHFKMSFREHSRFNQAVTVLFISPKIATEGTQSSGWKDSWETAKGKWGGKQSAYFTNTHFHWQAPIALPTIIIHNLWKTKTETTACDCSLSSHFQFQCHLYEITT